MTYKSCKKKKYLAGARVIRTIKTQNKRECGVCVCVFESPSKNKKKKKKSTNQPKTDCRITCCHRRGKRIATPMMMAMAMTTYLLKREKRSTVVVAWLLAFVLV